MKVEYESESGCLAITFIFVLFTVAENFMYASFVVCLQHKVLLQSVLWKMLRHHLRNMLTLEASVKYVL